MDETKYECGVCCQMFATKDQFLGHHMEQFGQVFTCCRCSEGFKTSTELYQHYETHKIDSGVVLMQDEMVLEYENEQEEEEEEIITIQSDIAEANDLLYILDDSQCVNEVVIEEEIPQDTHPKVQKPDNLTIVNLEHGYVIPNVIEEDIEESNFTVKIESNQALSTRNMYQPKPRAPQPKRRHEVPDFSATNYIILAPNEEVNVQHFKCLRCEQLFISKFAFFRHIEKGKCFINNCDVCTATFNKNSDFHDHYIENHIDRAICHFCFRTFMYEKNVKEHMLRHLDQFRHRCEECSKGFYTVREYRNHYKNRHMGIRHKCQTCGRSFADEYYFKRHIAAHAKSKTIV